jgi:hypothetical protein
MSKQKNGNSTQQCKSNKNKHKREQLSKQHKQQHSKRARRPNAQANAGENNASKGHGKHPNGQKLMLLPGDKMCGREGIGSPQYRTNSL